MTAGIAPGARLAQGRYLVEELIGQGGMAAVHRGRDTELARLVAIKTMNAAMMADAASRERFRREARAAAGLSHAGVVTVHDVGEEELADGRVPYIVMEYVDGRTLGHWVPGSPGGLPLLEALRFTADMLDALAASHAQGMVHRDIKPANVMVTGDGSVKVMDFGIARALDGQATALTSAGYTLGTPHYMSPEQFEPGRAIDGRADLYAVGVVLFQLLTGAMPFDADSGFRIGYLHVTAEPPTLAGLGAHVPPGVEALVARALAKHPDDRFPDAQTMRAQVLRLQADARGTDIGYVPTVAAPTSVGPHQADTVTPGRPGQRPMGPDAPPRPQTPPPVPPAGPQAARRSLTRGQQLPLLLGAYAAAVLALVIGAIAVLAGPTDISPWWFAIPLAASLAGAALAIPVALNHRRDRGGTSFSVALATHAALGLHSGLCIAFISLLAVGITAPEETKPSQATHNRQHVINVVAYQWSWGFNYLGDVDPANPPEEIEALPKEQLRAIPSGGEGGVHDAGIPGTESPDTSGTSPVLVLPRGEKIRFVLTSRDVVHSLQVLPLLEKQDAIPGQPSVFEMTPEKEGTFRGECAELCGTGHDGMTLSVKVVTPEDYREHLQELAEKGQTGYIPTGAPAG